MASNLPDNGTNQPASSSPTDNSFTPGENRKDQQASSSPADTNFTPADNSTNQEIHESCSAPWAWIAVSIVFMLLIILLFTATIILICIIRNMAKELKKLKKGNTCENKGEKTCLVQVFEATFTYTMHTRTLKVLGAFALRTININHCN